MSVVFITGGCGDIGRATAAAFVCRGHTVVASDVLSPQEAEKRLEGCGVAAYVRCDVADRVSVREAIAETERRFEGVDVAVANAGIVESQDALDVSLEGWQRILDVNLTGAFNTAQEVATSM